MIASRRWPQAKGRISRSSFHQAGLPDFLARLVDPFVDELGDILRMGGFAQTRPKKLVLLDRVEESFNRDDGVPGPSPRAPRLVTSRASDSSAPSLMESLELRTKAVSPKE